MFLTSSVVLALARRLRALVWIPFQPMGPASLYQPTDYLDVWQTEHLPLPDRCPDALSTEPLIRPDFPVVIADVALTLAILWAAWRQLKASREQGNESTAS